MNFDCGSFEYLMYLAGLSSSYTSREVVYEIEESEGGVFCLMTVWQTGNHCIFCGTAREIGRYLESLLWQAKEALDEAVKEIGISKR